MSNYEELTVLREIEEEGINKDDSIDEGRMRNYRLILQRNARIVVGMFCSILVLSVAVLAMYGNSTIGHTAHVLYPVTTDLSYEDVTVINSTLVSYDRVLVYKIICYVDVTLLLLVALVVDLIYFVHLVYKTNFSPASVPILSTVSIWRWVNYGLSGGFLLVISALVVGVNDLFNLLYIQFAHWIISGLFYFSDRRNGALLKKVRQTDDRVKPVKWLYIIFPTILLVIAFMLLSVYFAYLLYESRGLDHIWFNMTVFILTVIYFSIMTMYTIYTYYIVSINLGIGFIDMVPRMSFRIVGIVVYKIALFVCILVVSITDLPLAAH